MFRFTCLCTPRSDGRARSALNCRNTTRPHAYKEKKWLAARSLSVFSELLHTCNTSLSLIVWRGTKASQGGEKKLKKVFDGDIKHAIKESGIMRHLLTFHVCTTLCLQLIFGSFLTGSFLPLDTDRTGRLRRCFSGLLRKTFPSQRMEMDPPDRSIGSHWFAL